MGNQDVGQIARPLQLGQQVEDLRLHRDVQRGGGLVEHDDVRVRRQGSGNSDPLALAAGELVGKTVQVLRTDTDLGGHFRGNAAHLFA